MLNLDLQRDILEKRNRRIITFSVCFLAVLTYVAIDPNSVIAIAILCIPAWLFYNFYSENSDFSSTISPNLVIYLFVTGFSSVAILALCCQYTVLAILSNLLWGISASDFIFLSDEVGTVRAVLQLTGKQSVVVGLLIVGFIAFGVAAVSEEVSKYAGYTWTSLVDKMTKSKHTLDDEAAAPRSRSRSRSGSNGLGTGDAGRTRFNSKLYVERSRRRRAAAGKSPYEVVLTMLIIGLGFATMEGVNAVCSSSLPMLDRARMALWRTLLATTIHLTCCVLTGIGIIKHSLFNSSPSWVGRESFATKMTARTQSPTWISRKGGLWRILLPAILIHGLYDLITFVVSHYVPMGSWSSKQGMQWILLYGVCVAAAAYFAIKAAASSVPFRQLHDNPDWEGLPIHRISMADDDAGGWKRRSYQRRGPVDFIRAKSRGGMRKRLTHRYLV